jgi:hypothetical protein
VSAAAAPRAISSQEIALGKNHPGVAARSPCESPNRLCSVTGMTYDFARMNVSKLTAFAVALSISFLFQLCAQNPHVGYQCDFSNWMI